MIETIIKRDGTEVPFNPEALTKWAKWAAYSDLDVDWFSTAAEAYSRCPDRCTTKELNKALMQTCIDKESTPYSYMAGRLLMGEAYKQAFGGHDNIPDVETMYHHMVGLGLWEDMGYTDEELREINKFVDHSRDLEMTYSAVNQVITKYAVIDVHTRSTYETPTYAYLRMALGVCKDETVDRIALVKGYYNDFSKEVINTPTPNRTNLGTEKRKYASCCVSTTWDDAASLAAADHITYMMTCASAGQGTHVKTRSKGDGIRNNTIKHAGKINYYKVTKATVHANKQGERGGAATMHFNCLDPEVMTLLRLSHPTTVAEKQVRGMDYSFGYHPEFLRRALANEDWMLVSYADGPDLYNALYSGVPGFFEHVYADYEASNKPRTVIKAREIGNLFLTVQEETSRLYEHNTYQLNHHTPFLDTIWSSNLCQEIGLPTEGYLSVKDLYDEDNEMGEIGLCNLAAIVAGRVSDEEYEGVAYRTAKMIANVIDIMEYPFPHLKKTAQARRSIGVGITNLAHDLASKGFLYTDQIAKDYMHRMAERHSFWLHVASVRLAKERGVCPWFHKTKYFKGWLPIDTYSKGVDSITSQELLMDWEWLRGEIAKYGMYFSVLEAFMPCESSSIASNTTNSLYPIRELAVIKTVGSNKSVFLAPDMEELAPFYQLAYTIPHNDMIDCYAIYQKFCGQGISADTWRAFKPNEKRSISLKELYKQWKYRCDKGLKTKYYTNTAAGIDLPEQDNACGGGGCTL